MSIYLYRCIQKLYVSDYDSDDDISLMMMLMVMKVMMIMMFLVILMMTMMTMSAFADNEVVGYCK